MHSVILKTSFVGSNLYYEYGMKQMYAAMQNPNQLLLLEYKDTITKTRLHGSKNILFNEANIKSQGIEIVETDRGGDVTFHGQGQLVGYPIIKLPKIKAAKFEHHVDFYLYIKNLEQALFKFCLAVGLKNTYLIEKHTGVWIKNPKQNPKKLIAIGVGISKGVTKHGFALNIFTDLTRFQKFIVPCGISDMGITSLAEEFCYLQKPMPSINDICFNISHYIAKQFELKATFVKPFLPKITVLQPYTDANFNANTADDFSMGALNG